MKKRTKAQIIKDMIADNEEEIIKMEIVRDFNLTRDDADAKIQVDAANERIKKNEVQLTWLKSQIKKSLE